MRPRHSCIGSGFLHVAGRRRRRGNESVPERVRPDGLARGADRQHGRRLATANRLAPAQTRGQVLSTYFEFAYVGLTVPVIAVGFGSRAFGDFRATLVCAIALAAIELLRNIGLICSMKHDLARRCIQSPSDVNVKSDIIGSIRSGDVGADISCGSWHVGASWRSNVVAV